MTLDKRLQDNPCVPSVSSPYGVLIRFSEVRAPHGQLTIDCLYRIQESVLSVAGGKEQDIAYSFVCGNRPQTHGLYPIRLDSKRQADQFFSVPGRYLHLADVRINTPSSDSWIFVCEGAAAVHISPMVGPVESAVPIVEAGLGYFWNGRLMVVDSLAIQRCLDRRDWPLDRRNWPFRRDGGLR